jgi:hypothetical protein
MIGNRRIEVHCLGDYEPQVYDLGGATGGALGAEPEEQPGTKGDQAVERSQYTKAALEKKTAKELREIASVFINKTGGMKKAELIEAILGE